MLMTDQSNRFVFVDDIYEEKASTKKPEWLKIRYKSNDEFAHTAHSLKKSAMNTICVEGACPNRNECWSRSHASFLLMGDTCTRSCRFCNVKNGRPEKLDETEPTRLAQTIIDMGIKYVVLTSVDRDDLDDGGANHFVQCIKTVREASPLTKIELLTPDFRKSKQSGAYAAHIIVANAMPDVFGHNIETVARLHRKIRPAARYFHSMMVLSDVKKTHPSIITKSGIMLGLGEIKEEVLQTMDDLRAANVDCVTIGQYLRPSEANIGVSRYVHPEEFEMYKKEALKRGFLGVSAGPFIRTSYRANDLYTAAMNSSQIAI